MGGHTPGKWVADESVTTPGFFSVYSRDIGIGEGDIVYMPGSLRRDETEANARLIAAAPDLLEALNRYVEHFGDPLQCACAAIAKATGGQP